MALPQHFLELAEKVRNWGRWGPDDELGTLNLITDEVVKKGGACVQVGKRFSLALPLSESEGIQMGFIPGRINPTRAMVDLHGPQGTDPDGSRVNDDLVVMGLQCGTHWDGLGHVTYGGKMWNGYPADLIDVHGAKKCGIHKVRTLIGRGVLLDVARARGVDVLDDLHKIDAADLDAAEELAGVRVEPGDIVLVRTGKMRFMTQDVPDKFGYLGNQPGIGMAAVPWFRARDVAAVATDTMVFETYPYEIPEVGVPVHCLHLVDMGLTQGQNFVLEALAADCADDGRYAFLLDATPQPFTNAVGSPVNPVAVK